jgi:hypothetical protein
VLPGKTSLIGLSAAVAVMLAGCATTGTVSTSGLTGAQKDIATTIGNFQSDAQAGDAAKICSSDLAPSVVAALNANGHTCEAVIKDQLKVVDSFNLQLPTNNAIKVNGNTATAVVQDTESGKTTHVDTLTLTRSGQTWKIARLGV